MGFFDFLKFRNATDDAETIPKRKAREIISKVIKVQLTRFGIQLDEWKLGIDNWEDVNTPTTVELIRVYNDLALDPHLTAAMETRKSRTLSKDYKIVDENGEEIYEESEIFNSIWFRDYLKMALDSRFFGYSVVQFGNRVGKGFDYIKLVPREYVYPQKMAVRKDPYTTESLIPLEKGLYSAWTQFIGKRGDDLGLLVKAGPMMIYKKTVQGAWAEFAEIFGAPLRTGKTNIKDKDLNDNMYFMLENMGRNAFAVLDHDDEIEFIGDSKSDAYEVYDKLIERANSEISKLILGSTMVMDDGSSQSQAEVHERTLEAIDKDDSLFLQEVVNNDLIPFLNKYHDFNITGVWKWDDAEKISKAEQFDRDIQLINSGKYDVPASYITETYGIPLEEIEEGRDGDDPNGGGPNDLNNSLESKKKALSLDNEAFCDVCNQVDSSDVPPVEWDDLTVTDVINGVYSGKYTVENLPQSVYFRIAKELTSGMDRGLLAVGDDADTFDANFVRSLKNNAFKFSGAKTFQQVREMSDFIADNQGRRVPFAEYEAKATEVFDTFNRTWLRTEIAQAENSATMASKWQEFEKEADFFPMLQYDTVGDERVRQSHRELDGITRPINDPFWDTYYPPNGWNCRCDVQQEDEDVTPTRIGGLTLPEVPPSMQINVGKKKVLFGPQHPYFIVEDQFKELEVNNFNLPIPKDAELITPAEDVFKELKGWKGKHRYGTLTGKKLEVQKDLEKKLNLEIPDALIKNSNENLTLLDKVNDGPHYDVFAKKVYLDHNGSGWKNGGDYYKKQLVAHELGHANHFEKGEVNLFDMGSEDFNAVKDVMASELEELSKELKNIRGRGESKALRYLANKMQNGIADSFNEVLSTKDLAKKEAFKRLKNEYGALDDTIQAYSRGAFGNGHTKAYQKSNGNKEIWAHLSENYYVGNSIFEKYLPKTYAAGLDYMENFLKKNGGL